MPDRNTLRSVARFCLPLATAALLSGCVAYEPYPGGPVYAAPAVAVAPVVVAPAYRPYYAPHYYGGGWGGGWRGRY